MEEYIAVRWFDSKRNKFVNAVMRLENGVYVGPCDSAYYEALEDAQRGVEGYKERSKRAPLV